MQIFVAFSEYMNFNCTNIKQLQPYYCEILALPDTFTFQLVNKYRWGKQELSSGGRQWADRRIRKPFQAVLCFDLKSTTCPRKSRAWHRKDGSLPVCLHWGYHFLVEMVARLICTLRIDLKGTL